MPAKDHPVEIAETRYTPIRGDENKFRLGHGYRELPFDLPVMVEVTRHVDDGGKGLLGWSLSVDVLQRGSVRIKIGKSGGMEILVDGQRVYKGDKRPKS